MIVSNFLSGTMVALFLTVALTPRASIARVPVCLPYDFAVAKLSKTFAEQRIGRGIGERGGIVVELHVSNTGTWTVLVTRTNGISCIAFSGNDWVISPLLAGKPT
jgi:hypothetical protein